MKIAAISFGRYNPVTIGHQKLIHKLQSVADSFAADIFLFPTQTQDNDKNPLTFKQKYYFLKKAFPQINIVNSEEKNIFTIFDAINWLLSQGYDDVKLVVGDDRVEEFDTLIRKYINHPEHNKRLNLKRFEVISAGKRNPNGKGLERISGSFARELVKKNKLDLFKKIIPSNISDEDKEKLFKIIKRNFIGVLESHTYWELR